MVVAFETAPETKIERMRALGANVVKASVDACWEGFETRTFPGIAGTFVHPFDDDHFIAVVQRHRRTEIVEDLPDVATIITALGGGGLCDGRRFGRARKEAERARLRRRARNRARPTRVPSNSEKHRRSRSGSRRSSTAPAARASFRACGKECAVSSTDRSS